MPRLKFGTQADHRARPLLDFDALLTLIIAALLQLPPGFVGQKLLQSYQDGNKTLAGIERP